jgi:hypothetical protein
MTDAQAMQSALVGAIALAVVLAFSDLLPGVTTIGGWLGNALETVRDVAVIGFCLGAIARWVE